MPVRTITPQEVQRMRHEGADVDIIDVRTPAEYEQVHAAGARSAPLNGLDPRAIQSERRGKPEPLFVICKSGRRARKACEKLVGAGAENVFNVDGGTDAWVQAGLPVERGATATISLERRVRIGAGLLVVLGVVLGWHVHEAFHLLSAVVGAGLVSAGVTNWCGMDRLLAKMPWNTRPGEPSAAAVAAASHRGSSPVRIARSR